MRLMVVDFLTHFVVGAEVDRLLLMNWFLITIVHALIHRDVHLLNQNAVGWHTVSLVYIHDIADH